MSKVCGGGGGVGLSVHEVHSLLAIGTSSDDGKSSMKRMHVCEIGLCN